MSAAAPITETTLFLYSSITSTKCTIDFQAVGAALNLKSGTAAMRYRRLKERIEKQTAANSPSPGAATVDENTLFLYQCIIASGCKPDWKVVGVATGLKSGTAAMRWRRLQEKIEKEHGTPAAVQSTKPNPPATNAVAKIPTKKVTRKRKAVWTKDDIESEAETEVKKTKVEDALAVSEKRQTRGKVLNLKDMLGSSSSGVGTSHTRADSSLYEDSLAQEESDDESVAIKSDTEMPVNAPAKAKKAAATPLSKKLKVVKAESPATPASGSQSATGNHRPVPEPVASQNAVPPSMPLTPVSPDAVQSIEKDYDTIAAAVINMDSGHIVQIKRQKQTSTYSSASTDLYEPEAAKISTAGSSVNNLHAHEVTGFDSDEQDDMSSVAPEDSISVTAKASKDGLAHKRTIKQNNNTFLGKLWDLFG